MPPTILDFILESHFPPLLLPALTYAIVGFIVALRAHSPRVTGVSLSWSIVGAVGSFVLYVIPPLEAFFLRAKPSIIVLLLTSFNEAIAEVLGDNLISNVWLEVGAIATFVSSTETGQKSVKALAKWLWRLFLVLLVLTVVVRTYILLKQRNVI